MTDKRIEKPVLRGQLEYARLRVDGATHNNDESPSARMMDLYKEHDPSGLRDLVGATDANAKLREKVGLKGDDRSLLWGNGVINGPIDKLNLIEQDIREKHPDWRMSYDLHRRVLAESDLEGINVGDKVLVMGVGSWSAMPYAAQGEVVKADHDGWNYAQYSGTNRLIIRLKGKKKATLTAAPEEKASGVKQIAKIGSYLPDEMVDQLAKEYDDIQKAEGWPISREPKVIVIGREERML